LTDIKLALNLISLIVFEPPDSWRFRKSLLWFMSLWRWAYNYSTSSLSCSVWST